MIKNSSTARLTILIFLLLFSACVKNIDARGFNIDIENLTEVTPSISNKQDALRLFGSPSNVSSFGEETWYYISSTEEHYAFFMPKTKEQQVIELKFDREDNISNIKYYDLKDQQIVDVNEDFTITDGYNQNFLRSMFSNLGRFNKSERKAKVKNSM